jgi:two-component system, LytTR family, response regulator
MNWSPKARDRFFDRHFMVPTIRTIIADDEALARQKLRILLATEPGIHIVAECKNGQETAGALRTHKPDLLLLDVQMPDADGFEVLKTIAPQDMPTVIFTTAYDHYAIKAFEAHALDYLLKPFDQERLHNAIERACAEFLKARDPEFTKHLLALLAETKSESAAERLVIRAGGRVLFLETDEIEWIEAAANYVRLHAGKQSYLLRGSVGRIAERLDPTQFVRIHRSTIVNVGNIKELQPCNSGEFMVILRSGKELSCSRGYRSGLQNLIEKAPLG